MDNNQMDEAVEHLEAVREVAEGDGQQGFATIATLLGQLEDSEVVFQVMHRLRELHPLSRFALYYHALAALNMDDHETALESLDAVLTLDPRWTPAHMLRAQAMIEADSVELALEQLAEAVAAAPEDRALRTGYAHLLVNNERLEEARQQLRKTAENLSGLDSNEEGYGLIDAANAVCLDSETCSDCDGSNTVPNLTAVTGRPERFDDGDGLKARLHGRWDCASDVDQAGFVWWQVRPDEGSKTTITLTSPSKGFSADIDIVDSTDGSDCHAYRYYAWAETTDHSAEGSRISFWNDRSC
jgi:tetratricopeptide (TPR) repeat protein